MKILKKAAIPVVILIALLAVFLTLKTEGLLPFGERQKTDPATTPVSSVVNAEKVRLTAEDKVIEKYHMPEDMKGVWLDLDREISAGKEGTEFLSEIFRDFDYYRNFAANTIFVCPDSEGKYKGMKNADGGDADALASVLSHADAGGYYKVLVADDDVLFRGEKLSFSHTDSLLSSYSFDAVLLASDTVAGNSNFSKVVTLFRENLSKKFPAVALGAVLHTTIGESYIDDFALNELKKSALDFVLVDTENSTDLKKNSFKQIFGWWNKLAEMFPDTAFVCMHRADLFNCGKKGWDNYYEIADQYKIMAEFENFYGRCYYNTAAMKKNKACSLRISGYEYDGFADGFIIRTMEIDPANSSLRFTGKCSKGSKLMDAHTVLDDDGGKFDLSLPLSVGENKFRLKNRGTTCTFRVYDNSVLIADHYPAGNYECTQANLVTPYVLCRNGSEVIAHLNGKEYPMTLSSDVGYDSKTGYSLYTCDIDLSSAPFFRTDFGELTIECVNAGKSETVNCGNISVKRSENGLINKLLSAFTKHDEKQEVTQPVQAQEAAPVYPYLRDNGLGTALMCRIIEDRTEQLSTVSDYDTYHADYSTLMEGTIDYVNGISLSEEGLIRYELNCGRAVYAENCELIQNGFVLPENKVKFSAAVSDDPSKTDFVFDSDWLVPINVSLSPQKYEKGSADFSFNVTKLTAEYLDVEFYHTSGVDNIGSMTFSGTDTVNRAEVIGTTDSVTTLRLYLAKKGVFYGFNTSHNEQGQIILSIKKRADNTLNGKVVMLDPGHGGLYMTGTALSDQSLAEKEVTISIGMKAKSILEARGATVLMTRTSDASYSLEDRVKLCDAASPDIFVSIHCDGSANTLSSGTHTLYFRPYSQPLAGAIHNALVSNYRQYIYTEEEENYEAVDRKIQYYPYYVTRGDTCPSVLIETGFMTNETEGRLLADDNVRSWLADGIANGIEAYFRNTF